MADIFTYSATKPKTISNTLLGVGALFLLCAAPMLVYGISLPSTVENEMLPFIMLLCGLVVGLTGLGMFVLGVTVRRRYPTPK